MNERIAELWNKAAKSTKDDSWSSQVTFVEKFAELIVRECVNVLHDNELCNRHISHALNEHFRIEE